MKLGADARSDSDAMNSGSRGELVVTMLAQRPALLLMLVYNRNGKWSPPRGGLKLQDPEPSASSAKAFQVIPAGSNRSIKLGPVLQHSPLSEHPDVDAPHVTQMLGSFE